jgi:uroporphyrinogen decarboxylase
MTKLHDNAMPRAPDAETFRRMLRRQPVTRVPLVELAIADEVLGAVSDEPLLPAPTASDPREWNAFAAQRMRIHAALGYDVYRVRAEIPFTSTRQSAPDTAARGERAWSNEGTGIIATRADFERYAWPRPADIGFAHAEAAAACLLDGMGLIGFSGGVLEWTAELLGLENLALLLYDDPHLVREVVDRVGALILAAFETFCDMPDVFALWLGDDLGFRSATLISPDHLRDLILPWHRRFAALAHERGRFFLLHSCGHTEAVMPDLIETIGIDAKHSFEDAVVPVEQFKQRWGDRVAVLGGVDVDLLSRGTPEDVRRRTREILDACAPAGGYACGSGNSITNYVPPENFLAMLETVHRFNAQ